MKYSPANIFTVAELLCQGRGVRMTIPRGKQRAKLIGAITTLSLGLVVMLGAEVPTMFINTYDKGRNFAAYHEDSSFLMLQLPLVLLGLIVIAALWLLGGYIGAKFWQQRHRHEVSAPL